MKRVTCPEIKRIVSLLLMVSLIAAMLAIAAIPVSAASVVALIKVGETPHDVGYNPTNNKVYTANYNSHNVSVIDCASDTVVKTIPVGNYPICADANPITNRIYVSNSGSDTLSVIDGATDTVIGSPIATQDTPSGICVNPITNKIYVMNRLGGSVSVIDGDTNATDATISVGVLPRFACVNTVTNKIYVSHSESDFLSVIDGDDNTVTANIPFIDPAGIDVDMVSNRIYVAHNDSSWNYSYVSIIDGDTDTVIGPQIPVGISPHNIGLNPNTHKLFVSNCWSDDVSIIDCLTNSVVETVPVIDTAYGCAVNPSANKVYVTNSTPSYVSVISDGNPVSSIEVNPESMDFGDVQRWQASAQMVTISNAGYAPLTLSDISLAPSSSPYFSITMAPTLPQMLAAGASVDVEVTFKPTVTGSYTGSLEIVSNDPYNGLVTVPLEGRGVLTDIPSQQVASILTFLDSAVDSGNLAGVGSGNSATHRLNALSNMVETAGDLIKRGLNAEAIAQLQAALQKVDGQPKPPDFAEGAARQELADRIQALISTLSP
jgi:YVTN family beta-propeller protein